MDDSSATEPVSQVYTGVWTNWSRGKVNGSTITLTRNDANLLIAFLAFFIAWAGMCFWRVLCLIIHFTMSRPGEADGLSRQQRILLRNASDPETGLRMATLLWWSWRGRVRRPVLRLLGMVVLSFGCAALASIASIFSSRISDVGSEVLLLGNNCSVQGMYSDFADKESDPYEAYLAPLQTMRTTAFENAANYALQCYSDAGNSGKQLECASVIKRRLPLLFLQNASCPFSPTLCKTQDKNVLLDTGYLDSHADFGINAPPEQRFLYRRVLHCAPLVTKGYTSAKVRVGMNYTDYHYSEPSETASNFTYAYVNRTHPFDNPDTLDYTLRVKTVFHQDGKPVPGQMDPSHEFNLQGKADADLMLFFLSANGIIFHRKSNDPWYSVDGEFTYSNVYYDSKTGEAVGEVNTTEYYQREPASPLACRIQDQICDYNKPRDVGCAPLGPFGDVVANSKAQSQLGDDDEAAARLLWWTYVLGDTAYFHNVVRTLGAHALMSRYRLLSDSTQPSIPDNQWMLDVRHWMHVSLASMQQAVVLSARGPSNPQEVPLYSIKPNRTAEFAMCTNQKILSREHSSLSVLGLSLTVGLGLLIIILSYALDPVMTCLQKRRGVAEYQRLEWTTNSIFGLQRLAYEEAGQGGTWSHVDGDIPVAQKGQFLAGLDISDRKHPKIGKLTQSAVRSEVIKMLGKEITRDTTAGSTF